MRSCLLAGVLTILIVATGAAQSYSALWGRNGELWKPGGRIPDFSMAGYHRGEDPVPLPQLTNNIREFGAVGDGRTDDTEAFRRAIQAVDDGVIFIPDGRYLITGIIEIDKPNLVLRGEDRDSTILFFPKPLNEIQPDWGETTSGRRTSNYSWSGGFIWVKGDYRTEKITDIVARAERGGQTLRLASTDGLFVGQEIEIREQDDQQNTLAIHLYSDDAGDVGNLDGRTVASIVARITAIESDVIRIDRPLRFDLRAAWKPAVYRYDPTVTEIGIENLTFEFPATPYGGHFTELGYNPIALDQVADCWVRNVLIRNADSGPFVSSRFCTLDGITYESARQPDSISHATGHHGIYLGDDDNLFTNFDFETEFQHDISVSHAAGNVISDGRGIDLCLDNHRRTPYANLYTNIDVGAGTHVWRSGGGDKLGKHAGGRTTFWNIRADSALSYPPAGWGPWSMNVVGITTDQPSRTESNGVWFEAIPPADLTPQNLYRAQRAARR